MLLDDIMTTVTLLCILSVCILSVIERNGIKMKEILKITELKKSFGDIQAVKGISFSVKEGELFAFLGINGAGKSTTINMICGQLKKDSGDIRVDGMDPSEDAVSVLREIGVVFQNSVLDKALSVRHNLESRAALYGITGKAFEKRLGELTELLELEPLLNRTLGKLSGGQRRRIDIARALLHSPKILILDEPTTGLDPQTRKNLWSVLSDLRKKQGLTVFLTTHYMEEATDADNVVIIDSGRIAAEGTPIELKNKYSGDFITIYSSPSEEELSKVGEKYERLSNGSIRISVKDTAKATELIIKHPELFKDYEITKGNMDSVFLAVTGNSLEAKV